MGLGYSGRPEEGDVGCARTKPRMARSPLFEHEVEEVQIAQLGVGLGPGGQRRGLVATCLGTSGSACRIWSATRPLAWQIVWRGVRSCARQAGFRPAAASWTWGSRRATALPNRGRPGGMATGSSRPVTPDATPSTRLLPAQTVARPGYPIRRAARDYAGAISLATLLNLASVIRQALSLDPQCRTRGRSFAFDDAAG